VAATPTPASEYLVYRNGWPPGTTPDAVGLIGEATSRLEQALQLSALGKRWGHTWGDRGAWGLGVLERDMQGWCRDAGNCM
jgi:hypothetical protein